MTTFAGSERRIRWKPIVGVWRYGRTEIGIICSARMGHGDSDRVLCDRNREISQKSNIIDDLVGPFDKRGQRSASSVRLQRPMAILIAFSNSNPLKFYNLTGIERIFYNNYLGTKTRIHDLINKQR